MANDFSGDSNCVALYNMESGALTTDSKGGNTLTDNNTVQTDTVNYKQGAASANLEHDNTEYFSITDANLDAGFPFSNGESVYTISFAFWMRYEDQQSASQYVVGKWTATGNKRQVLVLLTTSEKLRFYISNSSQTTENLEFGTALVAATWYHVGVTYNSADKTVRIRVWDDGASQELAADATTTFSLTPYDEDGNFAIGNIGSGGIDNCYDGLLDEIAVFKDVLSVAEIDQVRAGTYGAAGGLSIPRPLSRPFSGPLGGI